MDNFANVKKALEYIDDHLDESLELEIIAGIYHFSPFYFHKMFSAIVGKAVAAYVRDRRLARACALLAETDCHILDVGMDCGFNSAQSFSRAFHSAYGVSPSDFRRRRMAPVIVSVDEMIQKFTNRLKGGIYLNPKIIKKNGMLVAGVSGDGDKTAEVWEAFMALAKKAPHANKLSDDGYEIRIYDDDSNFVHVGYAVSEKTQADVDADIKKASATGGADRYAVYKLPASEYASFDVYVANGYESENNAMTEWLSANKQGYAEKLLNGAHYCVEFYDERFHGAEAGSIVEIWLPIEKNK